jgi:hypothetical protein
MGDVGQQQKNKVASSSIETCVPPPARPGCDCAVCAPKPALGEDTQAQEQTTATMSESSPFQAYKVVKVDVDGTKRPLTEAEQKALEKTHPDICEWNVPLASGKRRWQKACQQVLKKCTAARKLAWPFMEPVNWEVLNIPDYPVIIKHPIDLRTIETKLNAGQIETPDEFVALVRTVFRNAYVYNKPGDPSGVRECAEKLSELFEKELKKLA